MGADHALVDARGVGAPWQDETFLGRDLVEVQDVRNAVGRATARSPGLVAARTLAIEDGRGFFRKRRRGVGVRKGAQRARDGDRGRKTRPRTDPDRHSSQH